MNTMDERTKVVVLKIGTATGDRVAQSSDKGHGMPLSG